MKLEDLRAGTKAHIIVEWPGQSDEQDEKLSVAICLMSHAQTLQTHAVAEKWFNSKFPEMNPTNLETLQSERSVRMLWACLRDAETQKNHIANSVDAFRDMVSITEMDYLIKIYNELDDKHNPNISEMEQTEFNELIEQVKKNASKTVSDIYDLHTLKKLIVTLANLPKK